MDPAKNMSYTKIKRAIPISFNNVDTPGFGLCEKEFSWEDVERGGNTFSNTTTTVQQFSL